MRRRPVLGKISHNFAHHAAELEAVAGEAGGDRNLGMFGEGVDDEVFVRGIGEDAGFQGQRGAGGFREIAFREVPQRRFVPCVGFPIHRVRVHLLSEVVEQSQLEPGHTVGGEAVEPTFSYFHSEDREGSRLEQFRAVWREPAQHLAFGPGVCGDCRHNFAGPGAGGDNQIAGGVGVFYPYGR